MKIGVVSDSHSHLARTAAAVALLKNHRIRHLLHCGDIGSAEVIQQLSPWPGQFVAGNIDAGQESDLKNALSESQQWHGQCADLTLGGRRIAIVHGHDRKRLAAAIASGDYDLVCCGHTHKYQQQQVGQTLVLNPGALYRTSVPSCAVVDLRTLTVEKLLIA